ncbi:hypothetical protein HK096_007220 [Nowakowskiella sp. JEL0078]|nr:hypothetical protein HK096_007220 [Nowakowskiella sp. JEL0078]
MNWVFGYGRLTTSPDLPTRSAIPCRVRGIRRSWSLRAYYKTVLGASATSIAFKNSLNFNTCNYFEPHFRSAETNNYSDVDRSVYDETESEMSCNGVIFPVQEHHLDQFDERESSYLRFKIPIHFITLLQPNCDGVTLEKEHTIWVYVVPENGEIYPDEEYPLIQSYIDVVLSGCLQISERFVLEFVISTWCKSPISDLEIDKLISNLISKAGTDTSDSLSLFYNFPWLNDRSHPRYVRSEKLPEKIQILLDKLVGLVLLNPTEE